MDWKNVFLLVAVVAVGVIVLLYAFPSGEGTEETVTTDLTINFFGAPDVTVHKGGITTWRMVDGQWTSTTEPEQGGNTTWVFLGITGKSNCFDQLKEAVRIAGLPQEAVGNESMPLGTFVKSIDGVANEEFEARGWQYYVNGDYGNKACNLYALVDGDNVEWKYMTNQFN